jgi:PAS domain S-box-containing protein
MPPFFSVNDFNKLRELTTNQFEKINSCDPCICKIGNNRLLGVIMQAKEGINEQTELEILIERYRLAVTTGKVGVWDWNIETNEIYLSPNLKAILGYEDHEIPNDINKWVTYVHPEDADYVMHEATEYMEGRSPKYEVYHRMCHKDSSIRWILVRVKILKDANGKAYRMFGVDIDVTERTC